MGDNIILIGFMGAGKTSIGTLYARTHGMDFLDTDNLIEETKGMTISKLFAKEGEAEFRRMETETLGQLLKRERPALISVGGGLPLRAENRVLLKELGTVIYLEVSPDTVLDRLKGDITRPLLRGDRVKEKVEHMLAERGPVYEEASHRKIDVNGMEPDSIIEEIDRFLREAERGRVR